MVTANSKLLSEFWERFAGHYINGGMIDPNAQQQTRCLKQANENLVSYIIEKLGINENSRLLDLGCGKGMFSIRISQITGCSFVGADILADLVATATELAREHGVGDKGNFYQGSFGNMPSEVTTQTFTHIISLGSVLYAHDKLDVVLEEMAGCATGCADTCVTQRNTHSTAGCAATCAPDKHTQIFIMDYLRGVEDWAGPGCQRVNRHLKLPHPLKTLAEYTAVIERSPLKLMQCEDFTKYLLPGYDVYCEESLKIDPDCQTITYPLARDAFRAGVLRYVTFSCILK